MREWVGEQSQRISHDEMASEMVAGGTLSRRGSVPHPGPRGKLGAGAIGAAYQLRLERVILVGTTRLPFLSGLNLLQI